MSADCIFCKIVAGEIAGDVVFRNDYVTAFRDINPGAPVHVLIVPKKHIARITDVEVEDAALLGRMFIAANGIAEKEGIAESGFRYVFNCNKDAGQDVFHIHLHLIGGRKLSWPPG